MIADFLVGKLGGVRTAAPAVLAPGSSEECEASSWLDRQLADRSGPELPPSEGRSKRALDLSIALAALVLGAPCAALAALAVRLTSPGPILYRQERVGRNGRPFTIYKFRSMVQDAEEHTGPVLARKGDSRSTIVGRLLRASKIDEWPQFYNVLRGDMSVVGPRPERPCFVQNYCRHIPTYSQRHTVRPGITGLAQVNGRYLSHVYVKLHYDLLYVYNRTLWLDLLILARTPLAILCNLKGHN